jgi:drug/metabolite transporter (DMT)-like permease
VLAFVLHCDAMNLRSAAPALAAALLFGAGTPLAKALGQSLPPVQLAGLLYLGSGLGLGAILLVRRLAGRATAPVPHRDLPWLAGAVFAGGIVGPVLLMRGLQEVDGASASLLLNLEGVLTALLAWLVFRENADRRIVLGMIAIVAGGVLLTWHPGGRLSPGALFIVAACVAWAIDNNLTRKVSANDALLVACVKGLVAGLCNVTLASLAGNTYPATGVLLATLAVGFAGYGLSLALFVVALRSLGTARTGAYFSVAPLFGVAVAFAIGTGDVAWTFWPAAALMTLGIWLHLRERHEHPHTHEPMEHAHAHVHDAHHRHTHDPGVEPAERHSHPHRHDPLTHRHPHYPDLHHRHTH